MLDVMGLESISNRFTLALVLGQCSWSRGWRAVLSLQDGKSKMGSYVRFYARLLLNRFWHLLQNDKFSNESNLPPMLGGTILFPLRPCRIQFRDLIIHEDELDELPEGRADRADVTAEGENRYGQPELMRVLLKPSVQSLCGRDGLSFYIMLRYQLTMCGAASRGSE